MNGGDDEFLDDVFERALAAATDGRRIDVDALVGPRPDLRAEVEATAHLALEVAAPRTPGFPLVPGYQVVAELGRGGMGAVFLARQERLGGRLVALKVLPGADTLSERARARFAAEAEALGRLRHAHVVTVHDVVVTSTVCAYAMEWIEGRSLARWIESPPAKGREPFVCRIALQIAHALVAVHAAGLVHRDVKPSNILVRANGDAVLVDFGLARQADAAITVGFAGTASYSAPEHLAGGPAGADARGDVYALGATLYHALAGEPPFAGRTPAALAKAIEAGTPAPLRRRNPRISRDLETIVATAIAVSPGLRYASAAALASDLERLLALQPIVARPPGLAAWSAMFVRRNRLALAGALVGVLVALAVAFVVFRVAEHRAGIPSRVKAHVEAARLHLLSSEHGERLFIALHLPDVASGGTLDQQSLGLALAKYEAALSLAADDPDLVAEHAVVATVARPRDAGDEPILASLPLLRTHAVHRQPGGLSEAVADEALAAADERERRALGLFAYLTGDAVLCSRAWRGLDLALVSDPLIDAAIGELHLQREQPALAYPRLEAAARGFPRSGFVRVQLAAAALRSGDVERAGRLLDEAETMVGHDRFSSAKAVRAEWHAVRGDVLEAKTLFEWLRISHRVPSTRARYARWLASRGERDLAVAVVREAVAIQPEAIAFRRLHVEIVEGWWRAKSEPARRSWVGQIASRGEQSWVFGWLREYVRSVELVADAGETAITPNATASPCAERKFLLTLVSALEALPMTLTRSPSDSPVVRSLLVSAWLSPWPRTASRVVAAARPVVRWMQRLVALGAVLVPVATPAIKAQCSGGVQAPSGLVHWWPGDGPQDIVGGTHAVPLNGATTALGKVGMGFGLDGVDDMIRTPLLVSYVGGATFECWVQALSDRGAILTGGGGSSLDQGMGLFVHPGGTLRALGMKGTGSVFNFEIFGPQIADGSFHHLALAWTGDTSPGGVTVFVDGVLVGSATAVTAIGVDTHEMHFGGHSQIAHERLQGVIDEVSFYNRALTAAEIQSIYAAGAAGKCPASCTTAPSGLVHSWPGNGNGVDIVGGNNVGPVNGAAFGAGKVGQGFVFDGSDDYFVSATPPAGIDLSGAFCFAWWSQTSGSSRQNVLGFYDSDRGVGVQLPLPGHPDATRLLCDVYAPYPSNWVRLTSVSALNDGLWHFSVFQRDANDIVTLHVDGVLQATALLTGNATPPASNLVIGANVAGTDPWIGGIDEVDFYSRALTVAEIQSIYAAGSAGKCTPSVVDAAQTTVDSNFAMVSSFAGEATILVTPKDASGALLGTGRTVILQTTAGTLLGSVTDNGDGTYTQVLQAAPTATAATVSATVDGIAITDTATVTFVPIDPNTSTITVAPDTTFLGGHATVTVTPKNDLGAPVGPGKTIVLQTTLGTLFGTVTDHGDGTYSQRLDATALGTAAITATANGLPLANAASLTVLDNSFGRVIGVRADLTALPYDTIQQAVNRAVLDQLERILVAPGIHEEVVHVKQRHHLSFEGLSAAGLVTVRGFRVNQCHDVSFAWFDVDASASAHHGVHLVGANHASQRILFHQCSVRNSACGHDGIRIARGNCDIVLDTLWVQGNSGDGIQLADGHCGVDVLDTTVLSNGQVGVRCADDAVVTIGNCRIEDSGTAGEPRQGYAILRQRHAHGGNPTTLTLLGNTFAANRGRVVVGKSDANLGNYDQILDPTDAQPGY